jgi:hypothetical protein
VGFLRLFHERANHDHPSANRSDVKRASDTAAACQPQFPQLPFQMLDVRVAQAFQPYRGDALCKPQKPRLHIGQKAGDFGSDRFVKDLYPPSHEHLYLISEI